MLGFYIVVFILVFYLLMILIGIALGSSNETQLMESDAHKKIRGSLDKIFQENDFSDLKEIVDELIAYEKNRFVVFIDLENDLDWETTDSMDKVIRSKEVQQILAEIDAVRHQAGVRFYPDHIKRELIWYLGRALVLALNEQKAYAQKTLNMARRFAYERNSEITRLWQLLFAFLFYGIVLIVFLLIQCFIGDSVHILLDICQYFFYGCTGVILSIFHQSGHLHFDCGAGKILNCAQIASKYVVGGIGACFIVMLFQSGIVFSFFQENNHTDAIMTIVGIIGGFSERMVPSLIEQLSTDEVKKSEEDKGDDQ